MKRIRNWAGAGLGLALGLGGALPAMACGGFFCSTIPVNQAGERIVFAKDGEDVSVIVQIVFTGKAKDFSWILPACTSKPVPPKLAPGPDNFLSALDFPTRPQFQLEPQPLPVEGTCKQQDLRELVPQPGTPGGGQVSFAAAPTSGVDVISRQNVGPFDSAILKSDDPAALRQWLTDNGYTIPPNFETAIASYIERKAYFVALRLRPDRDTGDLQPIVIRYPAEKPEIPIRLTSIAAQPDMGILVYMLGQSRAIPVNFAHVKINEGLIDWPSGGSNYNQVVTAAVGEAAGKKALVTDYAGPSTVVRDSLPSDNYDTALLSRTTDPAQFLNTMLSQGFAGNFGPFSSNSQIQSIIKRFIPIPPSLQGQVSDQQFYNNLQSYSAQLRSQPFDPVGFANELDTLIVTPYRQARDLFQRLPYLTRLFTTMSPQNMTEDPLFSYNPDLPAVNQVHKARGTILCNPEVNQFEAPIKVVTDDGQTLIQKPTAFSILPIGVPVGISVGAVGAPPAVGSALPAGVPAATVVEQLNETGPPITIKDNRTTIAAQPTPSIPPTSSKATGGVGCAGCSNPASKLAGNPSEVMLYGGIIAGFGWFRRRSRQ